MYKNKPKLKLLIVGDGPEKNTLQKLTESLKQKSHVAFLGVYQIAMLEQYFRNAL